MNQPDNHQERAGRLTLDGHCVVAATRGPTHAVLVDADGAPTLVDAARLSPRLAELDWRDHERGAHLDDVRPVGFVS